MISSNLRSTWNSAGAAVRAGSVLITLCCIAACGCSGPIVRKQSPEPEANESEPLRIGQMTSPDGLGYVQVEAVSLVTQLDGTGGDPEPSPQRAALLAEMSRYDVAEPAKVLASPNTAMVIVHAYLRPGIQKGDRFDVEVQTASHSEASSLRNGFLMPTRMTPMAVLGNTIREGNPLGQAVGPVLIDDPIETNDQSAAVTIGRVLGGGVAWESRPLRLVLDSEFAKFRVSQGIGKAINNRFYSYRDGERQGVATPKTDRFIDLAVHPRYHDNVGRYMQVIANIVYEETPLQRQQRLTLLESQLLDPVTSATAALRLEAIGKEGIDVLRRGILAEDPEVRFYAAEALAYLDETDAVPPLASAARDEPAFRIYALTALGAMNDPIASDALKELLSVPSAETRYGAFRSLWVMDPRDPLIRGETLGGQFGYHVLDVDGPPLVHVSRNFRPEVVLFGREHHLQPPFILDAGKYIMVHSNNSDSEVTVSRFAPGEPDQKRVVGASVDEVIRAIVELGGTYPDVVQALAQASAHGALSSRFSFDALPQEGRPYERAPDASSRKIAATKQAQPPAESTGPLPKWFSFLQSDRDKAEK